MRRPHEPRPQGPVTVRHAFTVILDHAFTVIPDHTFTVILDHTFTGIPDHAFTVILGLDPRIARIPRVADFGHSARVQRCAGQARA